MAHRPVSRSDISFKAANPLSSSPTGSVCMMSFLDVATTLNILTALGVNTGKIFILVTQENEISPITVCLNASG